MHIQRFDASRAGASARAEAVIGATETFEALAECPPQARDPGGPGPCELRGGPKVRNTKRSRASSTP
eukprot:3720129-Pyramimonas_sp.AAC.1